MPREFLKVKFFLAIGDFLPGDICGIPSDWGFWDLSSRDF